ncbi:MAG TPA: hypothetical protein DHU63_12365 [Candidatus Marinimicrobia bacterium]|nr:MAG: hypothetical protein AUJ47_11765 [Candidatus Marinimicrobia bacterium CG1_02_48_14]PIZ66866.1 MAG: hypothetical protein COY19_06195 [Candidatus Marinimicrobia bacterium CG_4_10_14_0_2_um_filter_48_9]PJA54234.1 MAG: hypothetical protein CO167_04920 [Candidatus Marinimicrobia bacterium CG_4_9_14_3_um_filter_48_9]HCW77314.1 hypothetical protein [Candidatus Neomarinimicrobiota bacterium]
MVQYIFIMTIIMIVTGVCATGAMIVGLFDRTGNLGGWIARFWSGILLKITGVSARVHGLENLDRSTRYIFIGNHTSAFDIPLLLYYLPFQLRMVAKRELAFVPIFGWGMWLVKHYFINRSNHGKALGAMEKIAREFKGETSSMCIFPEGTRSLDGQLKTFKKGAFILAIQTGIALAPVVLKGAFDLKPKHRHAIASGVVDIYILPPISTSASTYNDRDPLIKQVHEQFRQVLS